MITGNVTVRTFLGKSYQYEVETPIGKLVVNGGNATVYKQGDTIQMHLPANKIVLV